MRLRIPRGVFLVGGVTAVNLAGAGVAFAKDLAFAAYFGTTRAADLLNTAYLLPETIGYNLIAAVVSVAAVPALSRLWSQGCYPAFASMARRLAIHSSAALAAVALVLWAGGEGVFRMLGQGAPGDGSDYRAWAVLYWPLLAALPIFPIFAAYTAALAAAGSFYAAAAAPLLPNAMMLAAVIGCGLLNVDRTTGAVVYAGAILVGVVAMAGLLRYRCLYLMSLAATRRPTRSSARGAASDMVTQQSVREREADGRTHPPIETSAQPSVREHEAADQAHPRIETMSQSPIGEREAADQAHPSIETSAQPPVRIRGAAGQPHPRIETMVQSPIREREAAGQAYPPIQTANRAFAPVPEQSLHASAATREGLRAVYSGMAPLLLLTLCMQAGYAFERAVAANLASGTVTALGYAYRVAQFPNWVFVSAVTAVLLPSLSRQTDGPGLRGSAAGERARAEVLRALLGTLAVLLPAAALLFALRGFVIELLFGRGAFGAGSVRMTADLLAGYSLGVVGQAVSAIGLRYFLAIGRLRDCVLIYAVAAAFTMGFDLLLVPRYGAPALGYGSCAGWTLNALLIGWLLVRKRGKTIEGGAGAWKTVF
ncbi:lipid II flippase MurJ [Paenibacillus aurantiacus]|uniref:Lipid II flippase MurJ n=1 Tax=Paenibacillus aurantiacus TaxID=1936118 RepID=A0ABV5KIZ5_9BACL